MTEAAPQPRNPFIIAFVVVGIVAGIVAAILAGAASNELDEPSYTIGYITNGPDVQLVATLSAWADILGLIAVVSFAGATIIAGVRWVAPSALPAGSPNTPPPA